MQTTITAQNTENPKVMKFVANRPLIEGSLELDQTSDVSHIPVAKELFNFPFITRLFITANFIAVAKEDVVEWELIAPNLTNIIAENIEKHPEIILPRKEQTLFYTERTPNPEVVKFVSEKTLINGSLELKSKEEAQDTPLAKTLFDKFSFVKEIFINDNYIAITKTENADWDKIMNDILTEIEIFVKRGDKISNNSEINNLTQKDFTETEQKINAILTEYVAPAVENDGGKISLIEFDENTKTAKMLLQGACSGCPSSTITLKMGIENLLKNMLPNVVDNVEAING